MISEYSLKATTKKFEGKFAVFETEDQQELQWPIKDLPDDIQQGSKIRLILSTAKTDSESKEKIVKAVINHLLGE